LTVDEDWRAHERIWQADPGDHDALQRAILARRRAGVAVPGWMLERRLFTGRRFEAAIPLEVSVSLPDGRTREAGRTPGALDLPEHRAFWVQPGAPTDTEIARLAAEDSLAATLPGLSLRPDATNTALAALPRFANLERLDLAGCTKVTDSGLEHVGRLRGLAVLDLWSCTRVGDAGLAHLAGLGSLTQLNLRRCARVTDAGLAALAGSTELHVLSLGACPKIRDAGLAALARCRRLAALDLSESAITDAGLAHLERLSELTILNISRCPGITPAGLERLAGLANLSQLFVLGSGEASARAERVLGPRLPRCEIVAAVGRR
jgi:hypothetical protein